MVLLLATLFMSLGLINLDFSRNWWFGQRARLVLGLPLVLVYVYVAMPALVMPQALTLLLYTLIPNAAYSAMLAARTAIASRRIVSIRRSPLWPYLLSCAALLLFAGFLVIAPIVDANGLRNVADVRVSTSLAPEASLNHLRIVPEEAATFAGDKVIGQLGAYYQVGTFNIQPAQGKLQWVAPLEFRDFIKWITRRTSPGVIVVSAENPDSAAEVRQRTAMRYIPSAPLNDNLYRHVYLRYGFEQIIETTLQLDDRGDPQYIATLGRPTIGWSGQRVTAVVLVDPATGAMRRISRSNFGTLPHWVKRVVPPDLALAYNDWFGRYVHGWWNARLGERDVHLPARREVFGMLLSSDEFVWFVDHTSPASSDQSMTGFTYMDTVTGAMTYYTAAGGEFSSMGAQRAVASNPIVRQGRLVPTQPILYNAFSTNTWVVPLVAESGKYQSLALVQASNGHVVVGNVNAGSPQNDALAQYRTFLGNKATTAAVQTTLSGTVDRIAVSQTTIYVVLRGDLRIFSVNDLNNPNALLTRPGDRVSFQTSMDAQRQWIAQNFKNRTLRK
ncbi:MAG: hypothetical protein M3160_05300 [Candidatus Eremiobacteraeota bacterium]|nr:hypothetical protein [Candidatus Eremiobacteraeota bacterium]